MIYRRIIGHVNPCTNTLKRVIPPPRQWAVYAIDSATNFSYPPTSEGKIVPATWIVFSLLLCSELRLNEPIGIESLWVVVGVWVMECAPCIRLTRVRTVLSSEIGRLSNELTHICYDSRPCWDRITTILKTPVCAFESNVGKENIRLHPR
jgi:hypothetical protein